jgi:hypothetical protein
MISRVVVAVAVGALALPLVAGCGGGSDAIKAPDPPVGTPLLPDIVPAPPADLHIEKKDGKWLILFSSILVNIGEGDFVLRATREDEGPWTVEQDVPYSTSGAEIVPTKAQLVWGGDGHEHWHVERVAINWLVPLDERGRPVAGAEELVDAKVGFCFYDYSRWLETGPVEAVYSHESCGDEGDDELGMGLSVGWGDTYNFGLPGQNIDVSEVPDGRYRLWADADRPGLFRESRRDNNVTWTDVELSTKANGTRTLAIVKVGPLIRPNH